MNDQKRGTVPGDPLRMIDWIISREELLNSISLTMLGKMYEVLFKNKFANDMDEFNRKQAMGKIESAARKKFNDVGEWLKLLKNPDLLYDMDVKYLKLGAKVFSEKITVLEASDTFADDLKKIYREARKLTLILFAAHFMKKAAGWHSLVKSRLIKHIPDHILAAERERLENKVNELLPREYDFLVSQEIDSIKAAVQLIIDEQLRRHDARYGDL